MTIKIDELINTLNESVFHLKEDFELNEINPFAIETSESFNCGYKIEFNNKMYLAQLKYNKINNNECRMDNNFTWHLIYEGKEEPYDTIGQFMDVVMGLA